MQKKTLLSWSSGKDSAWALHVLRQDPEIDVIGLYTVVNSMSQRVAMHAVRLELLERQAEAVDFPLRVIHIPDPCPNEQYKAIMQSFVDDAISQGIQCMAFGDLFLEDIRQYREQQLSGTGIEPYFPLWNRPTEQLAKEMLASGLRAYITCIDPRKLPRQYIGQEWSGSLLQELPATVDRCGENGEFHTVVVDGPMFRKPIHVQTGETIEREGFVFVDVVLVKSAED